MYDCILAIDCFIVDLLEPLEHTQDCGAEVLDSEVITGALIAMIYSGGNFERARPILYELGLDFVTPIANTF